MNAVINRNVVLLLLCLSGCTDSGEKSADGAPAAMFPNYLVINAPSRDPGKPWYVNEYFQKGVRWDPETTTYDGLKMGMYELTQYPNQEATQAQKDAADSLLEESFDTVMRNGWMSKEKALGDGYEKMYGDPVHFVNKDYVFDGETLNPEKPEVLMYYRTGEGDFLLGVMYLAIGQRGPQVGGPLTVWHYHIDRRMCYERGVLPIATVDNEGSCAEGFHNIRSPEMLHVWFFEHPQGRFATTMGLSEEWVRFGVRQIIESQRE